MHNDNYDRKDPRCIKNKYLIEDLEKYRVIYETREDSKFHSKSEVIRDAIDTIYLHFKKDIGYAPAWLINGLQEALDGKGRPTAYSYDDRIFNSQFVKILVDKGSSQNHAINLLGFLKGKKVIEEGFKKEVRESYKEYLDLEMPLKEDYFLMIGELIGASFEFDISSIPENSKGIEKSLPIFTSICSELLEYMNKYHYLVKENDCAYPDMFKEILSWLDADSSNPLQVIYANNGLGYEHHHYVGYCLRQFIYSIDHFREENGL